MLAWLAKQIQIDQGSGPEQLAMAVTRPLNRGLVTVRVSQVLKHIRSSAHLARPCCQSRGCTRPRRPDIPGGAANWAATKPCAISGIVVGCQASGRCHLRDRLRFKVLAVRLCMQWAPVEHAAATNPGNSQARHRSRVRLRPIEDDRGALPRL